MKKTVKLSNAYNVKSTIIKRIFAEINSAMYIARRNIVQQNIFIKKMF